VDTISGVAPSGAGDRVWGGLRHASNSTKENPSSVWFIITPGLYKGSRSLRYQKIKARQQAVVKTSPKNLTKTID
jgi:hypothetical protein